MPRLLVGSLFSGIGGMDLGLEQAGMTVRWQVESDPRCAELLAARFPGLPNYGDVRKVDGRAVPAVDVLCGGFPCQDVSVAGARAGLAGERSGLFGEFARLVAEIAPTWVLIENVPGLLSSGHKAGCTDARCFCCDPVAYGETGSGWWSEGVPPLRAEPGGTPSHVVADTLRSHPWPGSNSVGAIVTVGLGSDPVHADDLAQPITGRNGDPGVVAYSTKLHNTRSNQAGKVYEEYTPSLGADSPPPAVAFAENQRGEVIESSAPALSHGGGKPGQGYPAVRQGMAVRRLTPLECERLQGCPDGWTEGFSDAERYRMLGNAVAVPVARWIGARLLDTLGVAA